MTYQDQFHDCEWLMESEGEYIGEWKNDVRHGNGSMKWKTGHVYEGGFSSDSRHNVNGRLRFPNGDQCEGFWVDNALTGEAVYTTSQDTVFKGKFIKGVPDVIGVLEKPNGDVYQGEIVDWTPHGVGKMQFSDSSVYEGEFVKGEINGEGVMHYRNGDVY